MRKAKHHLIEETGAAVSNTRLAGLVAAALGADPLSHTAVGNWMRLGSVPDPDTIWALAVVTGVRPAWLILGEGDMVEQAPPRPTA